MSRENETTFFGTDGIRGVVGQLPMTPEFVLKLGWAIGKVLSDKTSRKKVMIGKDTRLSGYLFESALECGLSAAGVDILLVGPIPTPAIAYLSGTHSANFGIVITASHNDYRDNGIKLFSARGEKIASDLELAIEAELQKPMDIEDTSNLGKAFRIDDARGRYIEFCKSAIPHLSDFRHLKVVIDCSNGATYHVAPSIFRELGATVIPMNIEPDGMNINVNSGTLAPSALQKRVINERADLGIAFDGDGDRVILVDEKGEWLDGDEILYLIANELRQQDRLKGGVIGTDMSNTGLALALKSLGIPFKRAAVGEHHVISALKKNNWFLGGEPSGHILNLGVTVTSDAIITALTVVHAVEKSGERLHELKKGIKKLPQLSTKIPCKRHALSLEDPVLTSLIEKMKQTLGPEGRILLRYSGTEPVLRLMIEGEVLEYVQEAQQTLIKTIEKMIRKSVDSKGP